MVVPGVNAVVAAVTAAGIDWNRCYLPLGPSLWQTETSFLNMLDF